MEITINGGSANQRKYAYSMIQYCLKKFLPKHKNISIELNFRRMTKETSYGFCCQLEPRQFEIEIKRSLPLREMLTTLAHELVHVKQYVLKEIPSNLDQGDYWNRPWEVEAHGRETGLFIRWAEDQKLSNKKWTQMG